MKTAPVVDSVPKVNDELAVGSDLAFQRRFLKFQRVVWVILCLFLAAAFSGVLGRGPLAHTVAVANDGSFDVKYEWVERYASPSVVTVNFQAVAIQNGEVQLWVSDSLLKPLGNQRVIPQPLRSTVENGGVLYAFPATSVPAAVEFQTQPASMGSTQVTMRIPGLGTTKLHVFVMP